MSPAPPNKGTPPPSFFSVRPLGSWGRYGPFSPFRLRGPPPPPLDHSLPINSVSGDGLHLNVRFTRLGWFRNYWAVNADIPLPPLPSLGAPRPWIGRDTPPGCCSSAHWPPPPAARPRRSEGRGLAERESARGAARRRHGGGWCARSTRGGFGCGVFSRVTAPPRPRHLHPATAPPRGPGPPAARSRVSLTFSSLESSGAGPAAWRPQPGGSGPSGRPPGGQRGKGEGEGRKGRGASATRSPRPQPACGRRSRHLRAASPPGRRRPSPSDTVVTTSNS